MKKWLKSFLLCLVLCLLCGAKAKAEGTMKVKVNTACNTVTVYMEEDGVLNPIKAFACSCGREGHETPLGTFHVSDWFPWCYMVDGTYGQYAYRIDGPIMFHSVTYFSQNKGDLEYDEYNKLGNFASRGCVRLCVGDAKWLCDNMPRGTEVEIYSDAENPGPLGKPTPLTIPTDIPGLRGWDPTDPSKENPWHGYGLRLNPFGETLVVPVGTPVNDVLAKFHTYNMVTDTLGNDFFDRVAYYSGNLNVDTPGDYAVEVAFSAAGQELIGTIPVRVDANATSVSVFTVNPLTGAPVMDETGEHVASHEEINAIREKMITCGHSFEEYLQSEAQGKRSKLIAECNRYLLILNHEHQYDEKILEEPSCIASGMAEYVCNICGDTYLEELPVTNTHDYQETIVDEAACEKEGLVRYTCSVCGDTYEEAIPALEHIPVEVVAVEAGFLSPGRLERRCSVCGALLDSNMIPAQMDLHAFLFLIVAVGGSLLFGALGFIIGYNWKGKKEKQTNPEEKRQEENV